MTDRSLDSLPSLDDSSAANEWLRWIFGQAPTEVTLAVGLKEVKAILSHDYPCAYFAGRRERRVLVDLMQSGEPQTQFGELTEQGFRRNGNQLYRPNCSNCQACVSVRVAAEQFRMNRTQRKIAHRNRDLGLSVEPNRASFEHFALFRRYQAARHPDGSMSDMRWEDYQQMIETSPISTVLYELRYGSGELAAVCIVDPLADGLSAVYSFFDTEQPAGRNSPVVGRRSNRSLGTYMILRLIDEVRHCNRSYLYLGYWIENSAKMSYKSRFDALESFHDGEWNRFSLATRTKIP